MSPRWGCPGPIGKGLRESASSCVWISSIQTCGRAIQGHLDFGWQDRFAGLRIEPQETGTTLLSGTLPDQSALYRVLLQLIRLGLVLLSLETSEAEGA
jgi:hypothetical protein